MANFFDDLATLLKSDERFVANDGVTILRNAVYEATMKMDAKLIKILIADQIMASRFFIDVEGVKVFDRTAFAWAVNNRQFLPDSYTRFKNKIGLTDESGELISTSGKVELVFPYKDCVLEGGKQRRIRNAMKFFIMRPLHLMRLTGCFIRKC